MKELSVKDRIIQTAGRLFYTQGYNSTGTNQIVQEADISKSTLYVYYRTKTDLLLAYLDQQSAVFYSDLENYLKSINSPRKKILGIFEYHKISYQNTFFGGCPFLKIKAEVSSSEKAVWDRVEGNKRRLREAFQQLVLELDNQTGLSDGTLADMLFFLLEGSTVSASVTKTIADIDSALNAVKKLI